MKKIYLCSIILLGIVADASGQAFIKWGFDNDNTTPDFNNTGMAPLMTTVNTTATYASGNPSSGSAYNTSGYPAETTGSGTAGIQFGVSTSGRSSIIFGFDVRLSNTASKYYQVMYTTDGAAWNVLDITATNVTGPTSGYDEINDVISVPAATTFYTYTVELSSVPAMNNNANAAIRIVSVFAPGTSAYEAVNSGSSYGTSGTVRFDNIVMGQNATLPIRLTYFTANVTKDNKVQLAWESGSEQGFSHFVIERSTNGSSFVNIGSVEASKRTDGDSYSFMDEWSYDGSVFYRLRIVNEDNSSEYSATLKVDMKVAATDYFVLSPNPATAMLHVDFAKLERGDIVLYDLTGRIVANTSLNGNESSKSIDVSMLQRGNYVVAFYGDYGSTKQQFLKM